MMSDNMEKRLKLHADIVKEKMHISNQVDFSDMKNTKAVTSQRFKVGKCLIAIAFAAWVLGSAALAISYIQGWTLQELLQDIFRDKDSAALQEELDNGEWVYLNGENIAVIVPESPTKVLLSADGGTSWRTAKVDNSDVGYFEGRIWTDLSYDGGYIGFTSKTDGYIVLTTPVALGSQNARFFLTDDAGESWVECNNLNDIYPFVITGVGFSNEKIGFVSYRYYKENGPIIWWTNDGCQSWQRLEIKIPQEYVDNGYRATPLSPHFDGVEGIYPIEIKLRYDVDPNPESIIVNMYSHDGGLTWEF